MIVCEYSAHIGLYFQPTVTSVQLSLHSGEVSDDIGRLIIDGLLNITPHINFI